MYLALFLLYIDFDLLSTTIDYGHVSHFLGILRRRWDVRKYFLFGLIRMKLLEHLKLGSGCGES